MGACGVAGARPRLGAAVSVPLEVCRIYVRRADESLRKHRRDPAGMCDWCAAVWRRQVAYPCFAARLANAVKQTYCAERHAEPPDDPSEVAGTAL